MNKCSCLAQHNSAVLFCDFVAPFLLSTFTASSISCVPFPNPALLLHATASTAATASVAERLSWVLLLRAARDCRIEGAVNENGDETCTKTCSFKCNFSPFVCLLLAQELGTSNSCVPLLAG